jgi:uncharacterized protein YhaN
MGSNRERKALEAEINRIRERGATPEDAGVINRYLQLLEQARQMRRLRALREKLAQLPDLFSWSDEESTLREFNTISYPGVC